MGNILCIPVPLVAFCDNVDIVRRYARESKIKKLLIVGGRCGRKNSSMLLHIAQLIISND